MDMVPVFEVNLCEICKIPNNLELISIAGTTENGETYLNLLKFVFNDIPWAEDMLISLACQTCIKKIKDTVEFKKICLECNRRQNLLKIDHLNIEFKIEEIEIHDANESKVEDQSISLKQKEQSFENAQLIQTDELTKSNMKRSENISKPRGWKKYKKVSTEKIVASNPDKLKMKPLGGRSHQCDICLMHCRTLADYDRHMNRHNGRRNYVCSICGRTYITKTDLHQHSFRHSTEATHVCKICANKKFKSAKDLRTHMTIVHTDKEDYKYVCSQCGKKCFQLCTLKVHILRAHTKVRNFKCDMCDKAFCDKGDLKKHYSTHSNNRAFKCDLCPAEYKLKPVLLVHKAKHHGIGNYKFQVVEKLDCIYCSKKIAKSKLARHIRTHTGEKPYRCRLCGMKFICNSYIRGHLKLKHCIDVEASDYDTRLYYDLTEEPPIEDFGVVLKNSD